VNVRQRGPRGPATRRLGPRQRRGVLLMIAGVALGAVVFAGVAAYVNDVRRQVGTTTTVFRAARAIQPYTPLAAQDLEAVTMPERWTAPGTRLSRAELEGRSVAIRVQPGTVLSGDMLLAEDALSATEREITVDVDPVTGIGDDVRPGDDVDVYAVLGEEAGVAKQVRVIVRDARVVAVGGERSVREDTDRGGIREDDVLPVTLALEAEEALSVTYAGAFAEEVRVVGLPADVRSGRDGERTEFDASGLGGRPATGQDTGGTGGSGQDDGEGGG
jgi:pilus assembly protein CpaB